MDKYEYKERSEQILKLVAENDYRTAAKIADTIDWRRVRSVNMLTTVGEVYERSGRYEDAKEILLMAYEKAPIGRRLAYRLTEVCIHIGDFEEAQNYYKDFVNLSPKDNRKYELLYYLHKKQGAPAEMLVAILEEYKEHDMDERWAYELALCYHEAGMVESCVGQCNEIFLWFREGEYVIKALELKSAYAPLTESQQEAVDEAMAAVAAVQAEAAALEAQRLAEIEAQKAAEIQAQRVAEIEAMKAAEAQRVAEEEAKRAAELQAKREAEEKARREAEVKRLAEEAAKRAEKPDLEEEETDFSEEINGSTENDEEREAEEKITAQNMEEIYGEQEEFEVPPTFKKLSGDTIDIRKEQGIIRRNFVVEEEENKLSSVSDDQIEGQMTLAEILANYEKNNGWEVVDSDSTKKELSCEEAIGETAEESVAGSVEDAVGEYVEEAVEEPEEAVVEEAVNEAEEALQAEPSDVIEVEAEEESLPYIEAEEELEDLPDIESAEADTEEFFAEPEESFSGNEYEDVSVESITEAVERAADEMIHATESAWNADSGLTYEQKEIFRRFLFMKGMEEQLALLFRDVAAARPDNNSASGNLLVVGEYKSGKTTLAIDVMKEINRIQERKGRKIAKISGERLNYKGLRETFSHLQDADLLVEHAGRMSKATLQGLLRFMGGETGGMLIVFEDTKEGMEYILTQVPEARAYFSYYLELKEVEISEWVDLARQYAKEKNYKIDDMAKLALSARIAEISHDTLIIEFEDVQEIVDAAIRRYNRKHFFKKNKKDEDSYFILKEADFK